MAKLYVPLPSDAITAADEARSPATRRQKPDELTIVQSTDLGCFLVEFPFSTERGGINYKELLKLDLLNTDEDLFVSAMSARINEWRPKKRVTWSWMRPNDAGHQKRMGDSCKGRREPGGEGRKAGSNKCWDEGERNKDACGGTSLGIREQDGSSRGNKMRQDHPTRGCRLHLAALVQLVVAG